MERWRWRWGQVVVHPRRRYEPDSRRGSEPADDDGTADDVCECAFCVLNGMRCDSACGVGLDPHTCTQSNHPSRRFISLFAFHLLSSAPPSLRLNSLLTLHSDATKRNAQNPRSNRHHRHHYPPSLGVDGMELHCTARLLMIETSESSSAVYHPPSILFNIGHRSRASLRSNATLRHISFPRSSAAP